MPSDDRVSDLQIVGLGQESGWENSENLIFNLQQKENNPDLYQILTTASRL